jgi:hypothetical protein
MAPASSRSRRAGAFHTRYSHASPKPAHRNTAQLCVYSSAASATARPIAHGRRARRSPSPAIARASAADASSASSAASAYMRVSCAYWVRNGLVAVRTAAIQPPRVPNSIRAAHQATGTASSANSSDSARVASSDVPASRIQPCSTT